MKHKWEKQKKKKQKKKSLKVLRFLKRGYDSNKLRQFIIYNKMIKKIEIQLILTDGQNKES